MNLSAALKGVIDNALATSTQFDLALQASVLFLAILAGFIVRAHWSRTVKALIDDPNEQLITTQVINWSYGDRHVRLKLPVQISYGDDPEQAMQLLMEASQANDRVIADPAPAVRLRGFGDNGINLELRVWIDDPELGVNNVRSDINLAIWRAFKAHGITIPFPQRDLHVKNSDFFPPDAKDRGNK